MKGFSLSGIKIPNVSLPNITFSGTSDGNTIKSAIKSAVPDLSSLAGKLDLEKMASSMLSDATSEGINLPTELNNLLK